MGMKDIINPVSFSGRFVDGQKFCALDIEVELKIPGPGDYEIHCSITSGDVQTEYSYGFQVKEKEGA